MWHVRKRGGACGSLVWKPERHRQLRKTRRTLEYNIKTCTMDTGDDGVDWFDMARDTDRWRAFVNTATKLRVT